MLLGLQTFLFRESNLFITAVMWIPDSQLKKTCRVWDNPGFFLHLTKQAMIFSHVLPYQQPLHVGTCWQHPHTAQKVE